MNAITKMINKKKINHMLESRKIKHILEKREYTPPVLHLEFLSKKEFNIAWQFVETFEEAGVAFAVLMKKGERELTLHTYGIMSEEETFEIYSELRHMGLYEGYAILVN